MNPLPDPGVIAQFDKAILPERFIFFGKTDISSISILAQVFKLLLFSLEMAIFEVKIHNNYFVSQFATVGIVV